jgi:hypothetical protein
MSGQSPFGEDFVDARLPSSRPHSTRHYPAGNEVELFLEQRVAPRRKERTKLETGEIVLEVDCHQCSRYRRRRYDIFTKSWEVTIDEVFSGNGPLCWDLGGADYGPTLPGEEKNKLRSRFDIARAGGGLMPDVVTMFRELRRPIPGQAICLNRKERHGRIIDLFDLEEYEELWDRLRRLAITLSTNPSFIAEPAPPVVVKFNSDVDATTWEWKMRTLLECCVATELEDRHVVRDFQNARDIRSRQELAECGKVRVQLPSDLYKILERDMRTRAGKLEGGADLYKFDGYLTPALAGTSQADFVTRMPSL